MESSEAVNQAKLTAALHKHGEWGRRLPDYIGPALRRAKRRPLFQKVVIANSILIAIGMLGLYLERSYIAGGRLNFLIPFVVGAVSLSIPINYLLVKLAFRPLDGVTETMKAIRAGKRNVKIPEVTDDSQIEELSRSFKTMLDSLERQRRVSAASTIKAQEDERKRIARELHDETSQSLTGLLIGIRITEELVPDSMIDIRQRLHGIMELAHSTLNEIHTMATRLRPSVLDDLGLPAALRSYTKDFAVNTGVRVNLRLSSSWPERLSPELETVLYRVVQEALTNVARHSGADSCRVSLERRGETLHGIVADNGRGFNPQRLMATNDRHGLGLHGMKERIELVGGSLKVDSCPQEGSTIHLEVPIESKEGIW